MRRSALPQWRRELAPSIAFNFAIHLKARSHGSSALYQKYLLVSDSIHPDSLGVDRIDPVMHGGGRDADAQTGASGDITTGVVMAHLCRRFSAWYRDDAILGMAAGRLTRKLLDGFEASALSLSLSPSSSSSTAGAREQCKVGAKGGIGEASASMSTKGREASVVLHSGHDVTVAPMLSVVKEGGWDPESGDLWPGYAAALRIELLREEDRGELFVRALYFPGFHLGNTGNDGDLKVVFQPLAVRGARKDGVADKIATAALVPFENFKEAVRGVAFFQPS